MALGIVSDDAIVVGEESLTQFDAGASQPGGSRYTRPGSRGRRKSGGVRTRDGRANGQDGSPTARGSVCGPRELWRMVDEMLVAGQQANERKVPPKPALATAQSPATRQAVNGTGNADSFHLAFEDPEYLCRQLITYIGNKRALLGQIGAAVEAVKRRLGKPKLRVFDVFSGSGVVSRYLKAHASYLASNDIEDYAATIARCYLRNRSTVDFQLLGETIADLNARVDDGLRPTGFIQELYAPKNEDAITADDRVFYTIDNARRLDNYRRMLDDTPPDCRDMVLASLLHKASVHANNGGVFKGFYKNRHTGIGQYGGTSADALTRILHNQGHVESDLSIQRMYARNFPSARNCGSDVTGFLMRTLRRCVGRSAPLMFC